MKKQEKVVYESCQFFSIKPHSSVEFSKVWRADGLPMNYNLFTEKNTSKGYLSITSVSKLRAALNWMMLFSEKKFVYNKEQKKGYHFKLNFITLTLSDIQFHPDRFIKRKMLDPFLKWLVRVHNCKNYVWKAETQDNGNIHFHITTNKFIHW